MRIIVTPIVTHQADRHQALKATLVIGSLVGLLGMTVVGLMEGPIAILVAFAVAMAALSPMLSLSDAYALSGLGVRGRTYGPVRLWGSVAFIAGNVGAGFLLAWMAPEHLIWLIVSALALILQEVPASRWQAVKQGVLAPDLSKFLVIAALLFVIGVAGVLTRRNIIVIFMSIE